MLRFFQLPTIGLLALLGACNNFIGPITVSLETNQNMELKNRRGRWIPLQAGKYYVDAKVNGSRSELTLEFGDEKFYFKTGNINQGPDRSFEFRAFQEKSGGRSPEVFVKGTPTCSDRSCERSSVRTRERTCTYYDHRPVEICERARDGRVYCRVAWRRVSVNGWEMVEVTTFERDYDVDVILTHTGQEIGFGDAKYTHFEYHERVVGRCR